MQWFLDRLKTYADREAIVWRDRSYSYSYLLQYQNDYLGQLRKSGVAPGEVVILESDYSPGAIAAFLAITSNRNIVVPSMVTNPVHLEEMATHAQAQKLCRIDAQGNLVITILDSASEHRLLDKLRSEGRPGLILFSSGSKGKPKVVLHDFVRLLEKFRLERAPYRTIAFLTIDHIGGINTLFHTLSNGGCIVTVKNRSPENICHTIAKHRVELLPTSPTFLNLLLISEQYRNFNLSSLKIISYGTEPMPGATLHRVHQLFPNVKLVQTYGLSEIGILRSKSRDSASTWVKVGGEGYQTKVVDSILYVRAQSAMLGYLDAPSPFNHDGWFNTEDEVEVDGDYIHIKGRRSEVIIVGGNKVYPTEVEEILLEMDNIDDATITSEKNLITGHIVIAKVCLGHEEGINSLTKRIKAYCRDRLPSYKVPVKVTLLEKPLHSRRYKKIR